MNRPGRGDEGQATVELALVLPFLAAIVLVVAQLGLVVRAQLMVVHAAREAARTVAVDPSADARAAALLAATLDPTRTVVGVSGSVAPGGSITVTVDYVVESSLPIVGPLFGDVDVSGEVTMRVEGIADP